VSRPTQASGSGLTLRVNPSIDREDASSVVTAGATANTTVKNIRASRESGLLCSHSHGESIAGNLSLSSESGGGGGGGRSGLRRRGCRDGGNTFTPERYRLELNSAHTFTGRQAPSDPPTVSGVFFLRKQN